MRPKSHCPRLRAKLRLYPTVGSPPLCRRPLFVPVPVLYIASCMTYESFATCQGPQGGTASLPQKDSSLKFQIKSLYCSNIAKSNTNTPIHASRKPGRFPQGKHTARANLTSPRTTHDLHVGPYQGSSRRCPTAQSPRRLNGD
jgi:hypothetical protein